MRTCHRALPVIVFLLLVIPLWAAGGAPVDAPPKRAGVRYVYLIRHGIYDRDENADDVTGNGLNALGHEQARRAGERLKALPVPIDRLVSSDLTRARETAADIGRLLHVTFEQDSLIRECTPGAERADYMRNHSSEDIAACDSTLAAAWRKYMRPSPDADVRDVLVCHGNVIRWFACRAIGADTRRWSTMDIANCSLTVIAVGADGSTRLAVFSDASHIPAADQTWSGGGGGWSPPPKPRGN